MEPTAIPFDTTDYKNDNMRVPILMSLLIQAKNKYLKLQVHVFIADLCTSTSNLLSNVHVHVVDFPFENINCSNVCLISTLVRFFLRILPRLIYLRIC